MGRQRRGAGSSGGGTSRWGSRWCTPGRRIIHAASAYSLAVLENLVHWNSARLPPDMRYVVATIPQEVSRAVLNPESLPGWDRPDCSVSQPFGDAWYDAGATAVLVVPVGPVALRAERADQPGPAGYRPDSGVGRATGSARSAAHPPVKRPCAKAPDRACQQGARTLAACQNGDGK